MLTRRSLSKSSPPFPKGGLGGFFWLAPIAETLRTVEYRRRNIECRSDPFMILRFLVLYSIFNALNQLHSSQKVPTVSNLLRALRGSKYLSLQKREKRSRVASVKIGPSCSALLKR